MSRCRPSQENLHFNKTSTFSDFLEINKKTGFARQVCVFHVRVVRFLVDLCMKVLQSLMFCCFVRAQISGLFWVFLGFRWKCIYRSRKMEHKTTKRFKQHRRIFDMIFTTRRFVLPCVSLMVFLAVDVLFHPRKKKTIEFSVPRSRSITF